MERVLYQLFDFQKFDRNDALSELIDAVHASVDGQALSEEELEVWAAGEPELNCPPKPEKPHDKG